jgi:drug/metabolite transporter (DMT)-like permease
MTRNRPHLGVGLMVAFCILAPLLDMCSKLATTTIPVGEITMARFVGQLACMIPVALLMKTPWKASLKDHWLAFWRAAFLIGSTFCFIAGVAVMPIADALAIVFVMPFILMFLGWAIFHTHVGPRRIIASLVGFGGALLVIQPSLANWGLVALFPLGTAVLFSFYELITQALGPRMEPVAMQLHTSIWGSAITVPLIWAAHGTGWPDLEPVMPQGLAWLWLAGVGFWAAVSHLAMTFALKYAPVSTLAPLHYFEIVTAVVIGLVVWGTFPNPLTLAGIAVIVAAGLYVIHREHLAARQGRPVPPAVPPEAI